MEYVLLYNNFNKYKILNYCYYSKILCDYEEFYLFHYFINKEIDDNDLLNYFKNFSYVLFEMKFKNKMINLKEELSIYIYNPNRVEKYISKYGFEYLDHF